ncbi:uncharacterized protein PAC_09770 [Phialocephala subalpina]|uniref:Uncharacterized protein n=1 Tax=Phialocephala subalpina TaxID=576137 RepID=A0A1L7X4C0_9HELO|nr:uncharacterized protein PAC_09770 [Phialocephala subalpina]
MGKHKIHRTPSWKRNTLLLNCILRIRIQPPVPYHLITSLLLLHLPQICNKLATKQAPRDLRSTITQDEAKLKKWLEEYLEERYKLAEDWGSAPWVQARDFEGGVVREIFEVLALDSMGFVIRGDQEAKLQIAWGEKGNRRGGSEPLGMVKRGLVASSSRQERLGNSAESDFDVGLQQALSGIWAHAQAPELPDTSVGDLQRLGNKTAGAERETGVQQEKLPVRQLDYDKTRLYYEEPKSADLDIDSRRWKHHQQRISSILQDLESIRLKHQGPSQGLQHTRPKVYIRSDEHLATPLPRMGNSFDHQFENILNLEKLIHEQDTMEEMGYQISTMNETSFERPKYGGPKPDYGEPKTYAEMAAGKSHPHLLVVSEH